MKIVNWKGLIEVLFFYIFWEGGGGDCINCKVEYLNNLWFCIFFLVYDKVKLLIILIFVVWFEGLLSYKFEIIMLKIFF